LNKTENLEKKPKLKNKAKDEKESFQKSLSRILAISKNISTIITEDTRNNIDNNYKTMNEFKKSFTPKNPINIKIKHLPDFEASKFINSIFDKSVSFK